MLRYTYINQFNTNFQLLCLTAVMCPEVFDPTNGLITYSISDATAMATYSCDFGYGLSSGDTMRICTGAAGSVGEWTGTAPTCEGVHVFTNYSNRSL